MNASVSHLWRHPIKGFGTEAVSSVRLTAGETMPWDRIWAVGHQSSRPESQDGAWARCLNYCRGAKLPNLMAVQATTDTSCGRITLSHPNAERLTVDLKDAGDADRFLKWAQQLADPEKPLPSFVVAARDRGMTDSPFPSISILNHSSLQELAVAIGSEIDMRRFRGNVWITGLPAWEEFTRVGKEIRLGEATVLIRERITRCRATMANPETGIVDMDTLDTLKQNWGHQDFGVYGEVVFNGSVSVGDFVDLK